MKQTFVVLIVFCLNIQAQDLDTTRTLDHTRDRLEAERTYELSRDTLDAARELEEDTYRYKNDREKAANLKLKVQQLYYQLYLLDKSLPGRAIVPPPFEKTKPVKELPEFIDYGITPALRQGTTTVHPKDGDKRLLGQLKIKNNLNSHLGFQV